jgi:hypothetical protein
MFAQNKYLEPSKLTTLSLLPSHLIPQNVNFSPQMTTSLPLTHSHESQMNANNMNDKMLASDTPQFLPLNNGTQGPPGLSALGDNVVDRMWGPLYQVMPVDSVNILSSLYHSLYRAGKGDTIVKCMKSLFQEQ